MKRFSLAVVIAFFAVVGVAWATLISAALDDEKKESKREIKYIEAGRETSKVMNDDVMKAARNALRTIAGNEVDLEAKTSETPEESKKIIAAYAAFTLPDRANY